MNITAMRGQKTLQDVEQLKREWHQNPMCSLEETPGFEPYREQLKAYRLECERRWAGERHAQLERMARVLGCEGNYRLAEYIDGMERQSRDQARRLERLEALAQLHGAANFSSMTPALSQNKHLKS